MPSCGSMAAIPQNEQWIAFFKAFSELPALWKLKSMEYRNRRKKQAAFHKLLVYYRRIDPRASIDSMRRKINSIRTCFNRELRRVEQSERDVANKEDIYEPQLWYYNALQFLRNEDNQRLRRDQLAGQPDFLTMLKQELEECDSHLSEPYAASEMEKPTRFDELAAEAACKRAPFEQAAPAAAAPTRDEADVYAEGWAISYRKLNQEQQFLAKKAIDEIFLLGQMQKLKFKSVNMEID